MRMKILLFAAGAMTIAACHSPKKNTVSAAPAPPAPVAANTATTAAPAADFNFMKPANGIYPPGNEELSAIQVRYADVTLQKLQEGHRIYTAGACINCHRAKNIYEYDELRWKDIMDDMAQKARMGDAQKDAVYKYVLSIKAAKPKGN